MMKKLLTAFLIFLIAQSMSFPAFAAGTRFTDIPAGASYAEAVTWCTEKGVMNGVGDGRFDPDGTLDRRTLATILYRDAGEPAVTAANRFSDVENGQWYTDAVIWADRQDLIKGYGGGAFGAADPVTQVQMDIIFQRYRNENPVWPGDPEQTPATRAGAAVALYQNLGRQEEVPMRKLTVSFNGHSYPVTLADNGSADAFVALLEKNGGSITVAAHDYGGFEKVGDLPESLPRNDGQINTTAGDLILYQGNSVAIYYSANSWTFTRLGRLEGNLSNLKSDLGGGNVSITYSLS